MTVDEQFPPDVETKVVMPGWQQPAKVIPGTPMPPCVHTGTINAVQEFPFHSVGDEWRCVCGAKFVLLLDVHGKKFLTQNFAPNE